MKLAIVNLSGGTLSGGYRKYLLHIIPLILEKEEISDLRVYIPEKTDIDIAASIIQYFKAERFQMGYPSIQKDLDQFKPDLIFVPSARRFQFKEVPVVTMVRNMEPLLVPGGKNPFLERVKNRLRAREAKLSSEKSNRVIAVSEHVKEFLISKWSIPSEKIGVVNHGITPAGNLQDKPKKPDLIPEQQPFIFTAGSIRPARGLEDLIMSIPGLKEKHPNLITLIAGKADPGMEPYRREMDQLADRLGVSDRIIWAGHLSLGEMAWCFQNCKLFVMTSRAEACPNIVLEALTHGAPAVSTDTGPMPEFFEKAAVYYKNHNPESLTKEIQKLLMKSDREIRKLKDYAVKRSARYTWQQCADKTMDELRRALDSTNKDI